MGLLSIARAIAARCRREEGVGVVTALSITAVVFALGATWTSVGLHQVETSSYGRYREQALDAAEAGVNLAISRLGGESGWAGTSAPVTLGDSSGSYEVSVTPVDPADPADLDRYIVATGYAPSKSATTKAVRRLEQQVRLDPTEGFSFALFASPGGIAGQNNSTITGDVYSAADVNLANSAKYFGDVTSLGNVTTSNNSAVGGDIHAAGNITIDNVATTVQGDALAGGSIRLTGTVLGDAQAGGSITGGTVNGMRTPNLAPAPPQALSQPVFTWDPANYTPVPVTHSSAAGFKTYWDARKSSFAGHHRVTGGGGAPNTVQLNDKWTMGGDVTIVSDGPIHISRDIVNGTASAVTLVLVSLSATEPAVTMTNNAAFPPSIRVVIYAPNAAADFSQLKDFHGVVYAKTINLSQQFTLTYAPPSIVGFSWGLASAIHFDVDVVTFREVPPP